jgi:hypothetical protein
VIEGVQSVASPKVKAILGYDIADGLSVDEYEEWLSDVHYPDLLANPYLDNIVLNDVVRPVNKTRAGTAIMETPQTFYRIVELHYSDWDSYEKYLQWFAENPIPVERSPQGRTSFKFYVLAEVSEASR